MFEKLKQDFNIISEMLESEVPEILLYLFSAQFMTEDEKSFKVDMFKEQMKSVLQEKQVKKAVDGALKKASMSSGSGTGMEL
jgi:hypothetical protein